MRLVLLSILVGVVLAAIGFDPWNIVTSIRRLFEWIYDLGFDAITGLWRYFLLGAVIVIPIWLISRMFGAPRALIRRRQVPSTPSRRPPPQVFAIAGPAMVGQPDHAAARRGRHRGDRPARRRHLLGGVAMASIMFDCLFWLFGFLRMSTVAFTAQALGAGDDRRGAGACCSRGLRRRADRAGC